jgi:hypothetical protein
MGRGVLNHQAMAFGLITSVASRSNSTLRKSRKKVGLFLRVDVDKNSKNLKGKKRIRNLFPA